MYLALTEKTPGVTHKRVDLKRKGWCGREGTVNVKRRCGVESRFGKIS
jgi:hypothetical protein